MQFQAPTPAGWRLETRLFTVLFYAAEHFIYNNFARAPRKAPSSIVKKVCLLTRCLAIDILLLSEFACAGVSLPSRCLAMGIHVTI
jgi:hypothetical protein